MLWAAVMVTLALMPAASGDQARETVTAIQIQGNTATSDDEVRRLAAVHVGMPFETDTVEDVAARLRATKRFEAVEVRKRFASIADPSQIVLVIVVDEGAVHIEMTGDPARPTRVVRTRRPNMLFLPVLNAEDGYGLTYGARFALADPAGRNSRLSFPLTWGGTKEAAAELDKTFVRRPLDRLVAGGSISRRTNPFFEEDDDRARVWVRGEREIVRALRIGATAGIQRVSFVEARDRFTHAGADVVLDTRLDPFLARNAVYARAAWEHVRFGAGPAGADGPPARGHDGARNMARTDLEARGYLGLIGQSILAVRGLRTDSSQGLPRYLQPLLGGMQNLRGFKAGTAAGDTLVAASAELIVPLTSPLNVGKIGVSVFADRGTVYPKGERFSDQTMREGYGGSVWFTAAFMRLNVAVAHGRGASTRVHFGASATF
jgi:surface antigen Omp85-like protein/surface antigen-like variable number repeat protein